MNSLGEFLKERRLQLGLTLEEVGDYVGVGKSVVSKWERGAIKTVRHDKVPKIARILQVTPEAIFNYAIIDTLQNSFEESRTENDKRIRDISYKLTSEPEYLDLVEACLRIKNTEIERALQIVSVLAK